MPGRVVVVGNRKGGVGKTTAVIVLGQALKERGYKVDVVDLDPQASLTDNLTHDLGAPLEEVLLEGLMENGWSTDLRQPYIRQVSALTGRPDVPLALVPCSELLWELESRIAAPNGPFDAIRSKVKSNWERLLRLLRSDFDFVLVDTAPGRTAMARHAFSRADLIIVPSDTGSLSVRGLSHFVSELSRTPRAGGAAGPTYSKVRVLWTRYAAMDDLNRDQLERAFELVRRDPPPSIISPNDPAMQNRGLIAHKSFVQGITKTDPGPLESLYTGKARDSVREFAEGVLRHFKLGDLV